MQFVRAYNLQADKLETNSDQRKVQHTQPIGVQVFHFERIDFRSAFHLHLLAHKNLLASSWLFAVVVVVCCRYDAR